MSKINWVKAWDAVYNGEKLPRKVKKSIFGKRLSKKDIRHLIDNITFNEDGELTSREFCPNCGCDFIRGTGNMAYYPEHWENFYCLCCNKLVGSIDNSNFEHVLGEYFND